MNISSKPYLYPKTVHQRHRYYLFLGFLLLTHLCYYPTWDAGFVTDFNGLFIRYGDKPLSGLANCFGFPAHLHVLHAVLYAFTNGFGSQPLPWYLAHTTLHALNAFLLFQLLCKLLGQFRVRQSGMIALAGTLFFLLSPYQSEVLTWRVCINYLMVTGLMLGSLLALLSWIQKKHQYQLWLSHLLFLLALFTLQLSLLLPLMSLLFLLLIPRNDSSAWKVSMPQFGMVAGYITLNRLTLGSWLGYYGDDTHLRLPLPEILGNVLSYMAKLLGFVRYYPHSWKKSIFEWLNEPLPLMLIVGLLGIPVLIGLWRYGKLSGKFKMAVLLLLLFGLALAPAANLYFNYLLQVENDRYSYWASAFFLPLLAVLLSQLPRWAFLGISGLYLLVSLYYLRLTNEYWRVSTDIYYGLIESFEPGDAPAAFLLNLPENYKGVPMFGDYSDEHRAFKVPLQYIGKKTYSGKIYDVAQYNMTRPHGGVEVTQIDSTQQLKVEFRQWGNWWWHKGIGMGPGYENEVYQVESHGHHYIFTPKAVPEGSVFYRQQGEEWQEVDLLK